MGTINYTTEPTEVDLNGVVFHLQGDPTGLGGAFDALLNVEVFYSGKKAETSRTELIEALAALAATPDDAETIRGLKDGNKTLANLAQAYASEVTGFPTQPSASSTKPSKRTGGTSGRSSS